MLSKLTNSRSYRGVLHFLIGSAAVSGLLFTMCGCDQISSTPIVQVIGEVSMDRKPSADTMVAFIPLETRGPDRKITELAFGKTDDAGRFELRTSEARGVPPGEYRVLIFRPDVKTDAHPEIDGDTAEVETAKSDFISDASLMLAAIGGFNSFAKTMEKQSKVVDVGGVPVAYNIKSTLRLTVKSEPGIIHPKFELDSHPKN